jgi:excisionase family DNA binding protein
MIAPCGTHIAPIEPIYLTAADAARLLRISVRTLYTYVKEKRVPAPLWLGGKRLCEKPQKARKPEFVADLVQDSPLRRRGVTARPSHP